MCDSDRGADSKLAGGETLDEPRIGVRAVTQSRRQKSIRYLGKVYKDQSVVTLRGKR